MDALKQAYEERLEHIDAIYANDSYARGRAEFAAWEDYMTAIRNFKRGIEQM
jgi:hypothetical protein